MRLIQWPPRADLAVGQGLKRRTERRAEFAKHLFDAVERNAADQKYVCFMRTLQKKGRRP